MTHDLNNHPAFKRTWWVNVYPATIGQELCWLKTIAEASAEKNAIQVEVRLVPVTPNTPIEMIIDDARRRVLAQREEILDAFVAKYGFDPERMTQVEQEMPGGGRRWFVRRMTDEEMNVGRTLPKD